MSQLSSALIPPKPEDPGVAASRCVAELAVVSLGCRPPAVCVWELLLGVKLGQLPGQRV